MEIAVHLIKSNLLVANIAILQAYKDFPSSQPPSSGLQMLHPFLGLFRICLDVPRMMQQEVLVTAFNTLYDALQTQSLLVLHMSKSIVCETQSPAILVMKKSKLWSGTDPS